MHVFVYNAHSLYCTLEVHVQYTYNHTSTCILCIIIACMYIGERGMASLARHQNKPTITSVSFRIFMKGGGGQKYVNSNFGGGHAIGAQS